jgi:Na+-transporting NADH:ubiquinone oxidoreductase subunit NqrC
MREGNTLNLITVVIISLLASLIVSTSVWTLDTNEIVITYYDIYSALAVAGLAVVIEGLIYKNILYISSGIILILIIIALYKYSVNVSMDQYLQKLFSNNETNKKISKKIGTEYSNKMETLKQNVTNHDDANIVKREELKLKLIRGNMKHINKINELIKKLINNEVLNANDLAYIDSIQ